MISGNISDAFADIILNAILTRNLLSIPTSYFFGLTLELPIDTKGTGLLAPSPAEYSRVEVPAINTSWVSAGDGSRTMFTKVDVTYAKASTEWGNIKGYTIYSARVGGLYLGYGITNPYIISAGMTPRLPAGLISVKLA